MDEDIIAEVQAFIPSYNCELAAEGYFAVVSSILFFRPHLELKLISIAVKPLYYLGLDNAEEIILWVERYLKDSKSPYRPTNYGMMWLTGFWTKKTFILKALEEIENED